MKLFFTGDTHGEFTRFNNRQFNYDGCTVEDSFMFICGDFGGVFSSKPNKPENKAEKYWLNWLATKPITFIIVPGNHENYDAVEANYPIVEWNGAKVRFIRPNIVWVERGEILEICGKRFWCFGGATSTDKAWRIPEESWWSRECASEAEFKYGEKTFVENWENIDYIVTHDAPSQICKGFGLSGNYPTEVFLNRMWWYNKREVTHFCGHLHHNMKYDYNGFNVYLLFKQIVKIDLDNNNVIVPYNLNF